MTRPLESRDQALATMSTWVASIADQINNPIAGILVAMALVEREITQYRHDGTLSPELVDDSLKRMRDRLQKLAEYVAELVAVARPTPSHPAPVRMTEAFATAQPPPSLASAATIDRHVAPGAEVVTVDPAQLKSVLKALVNNGLEAASGMGKPAARLRLSATREIREGLPGVLLSVEDNGPGFDPGALAQATDPFFSTKEASSGLGLAIAQRFALSHGGTLELGRSPALGGAAVVLFLPDTGFFAYSRRHNGGMNPT